MLNTPQEAHKTDTGTFSFTNPENDLAVGKHSTVRLKA